MPRFPNPLALVAAVFLLGLGCPQVRADDVVMKSGRTYEGVALIKETRAVYVFMDMTGKTIRIPKSRVERIDKKPTPLGAWVEKRKALERKDVDGRVALALKAREMGIESLAEEVIKEALKIDPKHEGARLARGDRLVDGKWVSAKQWKKLQLAAQRARYEKLGWKELDGEWVPPTLYDRSKKKLVEVQGHWVSKSDAKRVASKGLTWYEDDWYTAEDLVERKAGRLRVDGQWVEAKSLDAERRSLETAWRLSGRRTEIVCTAGYAPARRALAAAEQAAEALVGLVGEEPRGLHEPALGKLLVLVLRSGQEYVQTATPHARNPRTLAMSNAYGMCYAPAVEGARGAVLTFNQDRDWLDTWVRQGIAHAYFGRMGTWSNLDAGAMSAVGGWLACVGSDGAWQPPLFAWNRYLSTRASADWSPMERALRESAAEHWSEKKGRDLISTYEPRPFHGGVLIGFLADRKREALREWLRTLITGEADSSDLPDQLIGKEGEERDAVLAAHRAWVDQLRVTRPPNPDRSR